MSKRNGVEPSDPLEDLDDVISELEGSEWEDEDEITAEHLIDAVKLGAAVATGKHQALKMDDVTPTAPPRKIPSGPPSKYKLFDPARITTIPAAIAFVALVAAVVALAIWGPGWVRELAH